MGDDQAEDGDGGTGAADEGPVDRPPVRCSDRFAAPAFSAGLLLLQPVGEVFMNVAPFQGERHGFAVPMVFMTGTQLYTLRYVNFRRNSSAWPAAKPPENANPVNQVNPL